MKRAVIFLALAVPFGAFAQGFVDEPTCFNWNGGHKSAGSFSKCPPVWKVAAPAPKAPVVAAPVVQASPIMMPMASCPPLATPQKAKPKVLRKRPPPAKC